MNKNIIHLIVAIEASDLSEEHKKELIKKLHGRKPDIKGAVEMFLHLIQLGREIYDFFP